MIFRGIFLLCCLLGPALAQAQQIPVYNGYIANPFLYNPAQAGDLGMGRVWLHHRSQWVGMNDGPITTALTAEVPFAKLPAAAGVGLYADQTHILRRIGGQGVFAFHAPLSTTILHQLSIGVGAGFLYQNIRADQAVIGSPDDPALYSATFRGTALDVSAGISYRFKGFHLGLAAPQLFNSKLTYLRNTEDTARFSFVRHGVAQLSQNFKFNDKIALQPIVMLRYSQGQPFLADAWLTAAWQKFLQVGVGYRYNNRSGALLGSLGINIKQFSLVYSVETGLNGSDRTQFGLTHEVGIGFRFRTDRDEEMKGVRREINALKEDVAMGRLFLDSTLEVNVKRNADQDSLDRSLAARMDSLEKQQAQQQRPQPNAAQGGRDTVQGAIGLEYKKIGTVFFAKNDDALSESTKASLTEVAKFVQRAQLVTLYLQGNASREGNPNNNYLLATRRAVAAKDFLVAQGVNPEKILIISYGAENPATPEQGTEDERGKNRRVDIYIMGQ